MDLYNPHRLTPGQKRMFHTETIRVKGGEADEMEHKVESIQLLQMKHSPVNLFNGGKKCSVT